MWISRKKYEELIKRALITADEKDLIRVLRNTLVEKHHFNMELNKWCMDRRIENIETDKHIKELEAQLAEKTKQYEEVSNNLLHLRNQLPECSKIWKESNSKLPFVVIHCTAESEKEQPKEVEVKPYYFEAMPVPNDFIVTEVCGIVDGKIHIGSCTCRECKYCVGSEDDFIKCKLKPEGKAKKESRQTERRDEYGVISKTNEYNHCVPCIYQSSVDVTICGYCYRNNAKNEYYSSK